MSTISGDDIRRVNELASLVRCLARRVRKQSKKTEVALMRAKRDVLVTKELISESRWESNEH